MNSELKCTDLSKLFTETMTLLLFCMNLTLLGD